MIIFSDSRDPIFNSRDPNRQACPWECHSYGNPMGNVPWYGIGRDRHKLLLDGMGMGQINMSHGQPCESGP